MSVVFGPESGSEPFESADAAQEASPRSDRRLPHGLDFGRFSELDVALDPVQKALWCLMRPIGRPSFTPGLLHDLRNASELIHDLHAHKAPDSESPVRYWVVASDIPGIFNLGGDLRLFLDCIERHDRDRLRRYAHDCVEATWRGAYGMNAPCLTVVIVEGDALGGGFEAAISGHVLIAERGARMGMPEVLFNSFPGMGAYSFLARKLDLISAEKLILGGKIHSAEELHEIGVVDVLADKGRAREAARDYMAQNEARHAMMCAIDRVRKRVVPLRKSELLDVTDMWVETTMSLSHQDRRKIEFLIKAQTRRVESETKRPNSATQKIEPV